jgi:hypothetical protein
VTATVLIPAARHARAVSMAYSAQMIGSLYVKKREHRRAGIELVERLLFDWVDAEAGAAAVGGRDDFAVAVFADEAETALARPNCAVTRAEIADQSRAVVRFVPPHITIIPRMPASRKSRILPLPWPFHKRENPQSNDIDHRQEQKKGPLAGEASPLEDSPSRNHNDADIDKNDKPVKSTHVFLPSMSMQAV